MEDPFGNVAIAGAGGKTINLSTTSGGGNFQDLATNIITSINLAQGASTASFTYTDTVAGTPTITASAASLTSATQVETVILAVPTSLAFVTSPLTLTAGTSGTITIEMLDQLGHPINATGGGQVVNLTTTSANGSFQDDFFNTITSVTIAAGSSSATINYTDTLAGTPTIAVSTTFANATSATQIETINAAAATQLAFTAAPPASLPEFQISGTITFQMEDQFGNASKATAPLTVQLSSDSFSTFYNTSGVALGNITVNVVIPTGSSSSSFKFSDTEADLNVEGVPSPLSIQPLASTITGLDTTISISLQ